MNWQPIETAPKDKRVFGCDETGVVFVMEYDNGVPHPIHRGWHVAHPMVFYDESTECDPKYWAPLELPDEFSGLDCGCTGWRNSLCSELC